MRKIKIIYSVVCLLIVSINFVLGQNKNIDSLLGVLKTSKEDTNKVYTYYDLSCAYEGIGNNDTSKLYAIQAKSLAERIGFKKGLGLAYFCIGVAYKNQDNYPEALKNLFAALKVYEEINLKKGMANSCMSIGNIYRKQGNYPEALKKHFAALKIWQDAGNKNGMAGAYGNIGNIYWSQANYPEALKNYTAALEIKKELKDKRGIANSYNNIGLVYADQVKLTEALQNYLASLKIKEEIGDKQGIATSCINIGVTYLDLKDYKQAEAYCMKGLDVAKVIGALYNIKEANKYLSELYAATGKHKQSLENYKEYIIARDSILNEKSKVESLEIANQYESEKKEKEIATLNLDVLTQQKAVEEKNIIIVGTIAGALFLFMLGYLFFSRQKLKQKNQHQAEINKQQSANAIAIIQAQEQERNSIAKDLHDGVGTFLSTLKLNIQTLESAIAPEKASTYKNTLQLIDSTAIELRNVMKNLSNETLQEHGLASAIDELVTKVNNLGVTHIDFKHHGLTERFENIVEVNLYRVAQELINNCIKHAKASKATLQLIAYPETIVLMMEDNGEGFDTEQTKLHTDGGGMGLKNISTRVAFIKGTFKVESVKEQGTTFIIETQKHIA